MLVEVLRERSLGYTCPWEVGLLLQRLACRLIGSAEVEACESLGISICEGGYGMCPIHTMGVACDLGEGREPPLRGLLRHTKVGGEHLLLLERVK